jgi:hypothetical protein
LEREKAGIDVMNQWKSYKGQMGGDGMAKKTKIDRKG